MRSGCTTILPPCHELCRRGGAVAGCDHHGRWRLSDRHHPRCPSWPGAARQVQLPALCAAQASERLSRTGRGIDRLIGRVCIHGAQCHADPVLRFERDTVAKTIATPSRKKNKSVACKPVFIFGPRHEGISCQSVLLKELSSERRGFRYVPESQAFF